VSSLAFRGETISHSVAIGLVAPDGFFKRFLDGRRLLEDDPSPGRSTVKRVVSGIAVKRRDIIGGELS